MSDLAVVLGARGGTGSAVLAELVRRGTAVRAVGRSIRPDQVPSRVQALAADVTTPDGAAAAVDGAATVYHCAQPAYTRWAAEFPPMTRTVLRAASDARAKLVFADNLYMYGPPSGPLTEDTPQRATDTKGRVRAEMAAELLDAHAAGRARVVLGRSSDYFGPGGTATALGDTFFGRLVAGRRAQWLASLDQPHTMSYLPDMARALVVLGERDEADGRAWHLPAAAATGRELLALAGQVLGRPARASVAPVPLLRAAGLAVPMARELAGVAHQWQRPWVSDASAFVAAFGADAAPVTPLPEAVRTTVRWWQER